GLAARPGAADAHGTGQHLRALRHPGAGQGLDRRTLPGHLQSRDRARRAAQDRELQMIEACKLTPAIGAEVFGVDLGKPLSNHQVSELHDALMAHQVIFFRDQQISVEQHKAFGRLFGELLVHPAAKAEVDGHPEIRVVHADETTKVATGEVWHSDMSCEPEPPMGSILYLHQSPPAGGDTAFANMYLAYETLSQPSKRPVVCLSGFLTSRHVYSRAHFHRLR